MHVEISEHFEERLDSGDGHERLEGTVVTEMDRGKQKTGQARRPSGLSVYAMLTDFQRSNRAERRWNRNSSIPAEDAGSIGSGSGGRKSSIG